MITASVPDSTKTTTTTETTISKETQSSIPTPIVTYEKILDEKGESIIAEIPLLYIVIIGVAITCILISGALLKFRNKK